ncbi:MAG: hypothetical protein LBK06_01755, partial [Planctomycetaceae bacterium]|nr:hypothetical protein [Planctomycetaceae bacterium]
SFIVKSAERLEAVESRLCVLETKVATGNDKVIHLLGEQLEALKEIKNGQRVDMIKSVREQDTIQRYSAV